MPQFLQRLLSFLAMIIGIFTFRRKSRVEHFPQGEKEFNAITPEIENMMMMEQYFQQRGR